ncbi:hypothetical protein CPLU01_02981 [Colletotrichum plurivorum]|uniref:Uncharacterized protein n=1 Tax=Colletotrichum plurivorum TaxID=2175906 RepID=A0A8H6KUN1_9PEZI|nr:hypothetical protein CPLU01_02981 [Colletotrichum plurivorum]
MPPPTGRHHLNSSERRLRECEAYCILASSSKAPTALLPLTPSSAWNCVFIASNRPHPIRFRVHPPFQLVFDLSRPKLYLPRASNEPSAIRLWTQPAHTVQGLPRHAYGGDDASS